MHLSDSLLDNGLRFRDWADLHCSLLWAYEGRILSQAHIGSYSSTEASCWLVRKGQVQLTTAGTTVTAKKNQWAFVAIPQRHQNFSADAEILSLHFRLSWPTGIPVLNQPTNVVFDSAKFPQLERIGTGIVRKVRQGFPETSYPFLPEQKCSLKSYLSIQTLLPSWLMAYIEAQAALGNAIRRPGQIDERILKGIGELDRLPLDRRYSEADLIQKAGLGRSQFNALFHTAMGMSPRTYFECRRKQEAGNLIAYSTLSIKEISAQLGFRHASHFTVWFQRHHHCGPSSYRAKALGSTLKSACSCV